MKNYPLLSRVDSPADLHRLEDQQLPQLADELREFLIDSVAHTGGHLAAGLGTVELAIALHRVYNTPHDRLVWDIGHQAYPHKILTGRRDAMHSLRQQHGLSGFLSREESEYDAFGAGHSSTSISAALGMAAAAAREHSDRKCVAIIGDGAMTAGMAYEALNNAGDQDCDLLVILNDNEMSISPNRGAMHNHLARILSSRFYTGVREQSKHILNNLPGARRFLGRWEEHMKGMLLPGTLFEELGFNYIGPLDGHDLPALVSTLRNLYNLKGRQFLHIVTRKGKGYDPAEQDPCNYHGVTPFDRATGTQQKGTPSKTYSAVFGDWLCDMAATDERLMAITPAMCEGSGMVRYAETYADRYFDVGIAEQHALTFAGGLACEGLKPVVAIYSTFLQRAYDQLIHDIALQDLDITLAIDRAGLVGADGATHAGVFDLSFLRCVPNLVIAAPADETECRQLLTTTYRHAGPAAVRYPRGTGPGILPGDELEELPLGKAEIRRTGRRVAILAFGSCVDAAHGAGDAIDATVVNMRYIKPLDSELVMKMAQEHELLVTVEENAVAGGAGAAVNELLAEQGVVIPVRNLGIPDQFIPHGSHAQQLAQCGIDAAGIEKTITAALPTAMDALPTEQQTG
ncbi:MAG: 1-deoxy-D-xylulose-5-phosphate synthase [Gammaproteobacteria bacterium]|nr:MAG: 1-deoxy-D-xylulose-5-phosphate synthase [Gammaproteobacteria bacterium]